MGGGTGTLYWYMRPGIVAESDLSGNLKSEYVFFNGERVARRDLPSGSVAYYFSDHLKTASVVTDSAGTIKAESDFYPWGGELQFANSDSNHYKFTGKERDTESGLDYIGTRYLSSSLGRWMSSDPVTISKDLSSPQSLNKYLYAFDSPVIYADDDGKWPTWFHHKLIEDNLFNSGDLDIHETEIVEHASDWVDSFEHQGPEYSYMHAMSNGVANEKVPQAEADSLRYETSELSAAVADQIAYETSGGEGYSEDALTHFGHALHTVQDSTSPEHEGQQPWYGFFSRPYSPFVAIAHFLNESTDAYYAVAFPGSARKADEAAYNANLQTVFAWNWFQKDLEKARKKRQKKKNDGPTSGLDLNKNQSGYGIP